MTFTARSAFDRSSRQLVYVSGAPGAGKTSQAVPLAAALGLPLLTKDRIKETLHDVFGAPEPDLAWSHSLGGVAMELLWALAADAPAVMIEANCRPYSQHTREKLSALAVSPVEVYCTCPPEPAVQRYNARRTHPVHVVTTLERCGSWRLNEGPPDQGRRPADGRQALQYLADASMKGRPIKGGDMKPPRTAVTRPVPQ